MLNTQAPEPFDKDSGVELDFHSMFHTLQGEGPHTGVPSVFLRLAGCNIQCPWCDTEYTQGRQKYGVSIIAESIVRLLSDHPATRLLVITGGEPTRQRLDNLLTILPRGLKVQIESNGILPPSDLTLGLIRAGLVDYVVSPKSHTVSVAARHATCFKYVLSHDSIDPDDGLPTWALGRKVRSFVARPPSGYTGEIYINPMDAGNEEDNKKNLLACRDSALKFGYRMGYQLHKLLDLP